MPDRKRIFLIDGSALAYRSYFAFIRNPLINFKGENTSATFGFVKGRFTGARPWKSALQTALIGGLAAAAAFGIARAVG